MNNFATDLTFEKIECCKNILEKLYEFSMLVLLRAKENNIDIDSISSKMKNFTITVYIKPYLISRHVIKYELPVTTEIIRTKYLNYLQNPDKSKLPGTKTPLSYISGNPFFTLVLKYETIKDLASVELAQLTGNQHNYNFNNKDFLKQVNILLLLIEATK